MTPFLYVSIILLWGFTWIAIKNQIGIVPIEISLIYRMALAAIIMFFVLLIKRVSFRLTLKQHAALILLGALLFSGNFIFIYSATQYITSGVAALIFSTSVIMIMLNGLIFLKKPISLTTLVGGLLGLIGLGCIFWPELENFSLSSETSIGLILALIGTYCFAWANQVSTYCTKISIPLISSTFYGMVYGTLLLMIYSCLMKIPFQIDLSSNYILSLLYLAIPGSVFGFMIYLGLVKRLGPEKAVYTTLFFPIVALIVSTYFEYFEWSVAEVSGVILILLGNTFVLTKPTLFRQAKAIFIRD